MPYYGYQTHSNTDQEHPKLSSRALRGTNRSTAYIDHKDSASVLTSRIISEIQKYDNIDLMDPASKLQSYYQATYGELPDYYYTKTGSDHDPTLYATLEINGEEFQASGSSQKEAGRLLAETVLMKLKLENLI